VSGDLDLGAVAGLYEASLAQHGESSPAVGWRDPSQHRLRFGKLASVIEPSDGAVGVNDLGCGYGAFLPFLREAGVAVAHFRGYDISAQMVARARAKFPEGEFRVGDRLDEPADFSFACGIFNVRLTHSEEAWREHILRTLENLAAFSRRGFAFNLLTTHVDYREPHLYYGDPCFFFEHCRRSFGRRIALLHGAPPYEWTIAIRLA